ncbi:HAMP domain-containing sensor histidine kinase [Geomicrobium sp. JCM 19055]|uniref:HAMP domain-containing sensor histidine kinase n=1 Tax=Geomicrobium sp. JCM 19055 TaxID=1460649 RepID=UPI0005A9718E|nr:HAMP domain-containing sensor histidine kinase [Geomicrobium sp. JCM 19055]
MGKRFHERIFELKFATEQIRRNNLEIDIKDQGVDDEMSDLINSFNLMKDALHESLLKQWNLEESRNDFLNSISHDIRTPLTIIKANAEMINKRADAKHQRYISTIIKEVNRTEKLIEEFDKLYILEKPDFTMNYSEIEPLNFFQSELNKYKFMVEKKGLSYVINLHKSENRSTDLLKVDIARIQQVLDNLISNSIRFNEPGGTINVTLKVENDYFCLKICDTGKGFYEKDLNKLFGKYYQNNNSDEEYHKGLGLYIVEQIIKNHKGYVKAWNSNGACIAIFLPMEED